MQGIRIGLATLCGSAFLSACAPDAWKPDKPFDRFLNSVQTACYYDPISSTTVGNLLEPSGNDNASYFLDVTSRLYFGKITQSDWTLMITSQLQANATDRGVRCLLNMYEKDKSKPKPA
ncbi:MAG: hypothetical protein LJE97_08075 [Betaproteobacteria bacterium]|jgi:hypothetical protein|nr:hypothetical protein [Betaproteobacteria bacterium]